MSDILSDLKKCVAGATKKWTKQRKAEERSARARYSREYIYSDRVNFTDVAHRILPKAYQHASGGGVYVVSKRQLYYASREEFRKATGREITYERFASLVLRFVNQNREAMNWKLTADPRGTLTIPNTFSETRIPCGTLAIDDHLKAIAVTSDNHECPRVPREWPSHKPGERYQALLYIEKEGFEPLLQQARIAERYSLAVLSCKGHSVVAARKFVDHACRVNGGVPLVIAHDLDVFGFQIAARLTSVSVDADMGDRVAYWFKNWIDSTDLGLRLEDARRYGLTTERCKRPKQIPSDLGCTPDEVELLKSGQRIELNAFTAPQFVEWLEGSLAKAGIRENWVPDDHQVIVEAYRRAAAVARLNAAIEDARKQAQEEASKLNIPRGLRQQIVRHAKKHRVPWDIAVFQAAAKAMPIATAKGDSTTSATLKGRDVHPGVAVAEWAASLGISPAVLSHAEALAGFTDEEFDRAVKSLKSRGQEITTDAILSFLKRSRRQRRST
jgi:hypothetical protein